MDTNLSEIDILRLSLISDDDFPLLESLINHNPKEKISPQIQQQLINKTENHKKNVNNIHIPDAVIKNVRNQHQSNWHQFEGNVKNQNQQHIQNQQVQNGQNSEKGR